MTIQPQLSGKTIAFDLDGTLVDTAPDLIHCMNEAMIAAGLPATPLHIAKDHIGHGAKALLVLAHTHHGLPITEPAIAQLLEHFLNLYADHNTVYSAPFPGAVDVLQTLRSQGANLTICTNKSERFTHSILDGFGLSEFFTGVFCPENVSAHKPDGAHVLAAIAPAHPKNALLIGDSQTDLSAARAVNTPCFLMDHGYSQPPANQLPADQILTHFDALPAQIENWFFGDRG